MKNVVFGQLHCPGDEGIAKSTHYEQFYADEQILQPCKQDKQLLLLSE